MKLAPSHSHKRSPHLPALSIMHRPQACKRTMDCKCRECVAAAAAFSVDDLRAIKSNISYGTCCIAFTGVCVLGDELRLTGAASSAPPHPTNE